MDFNHNVFYCSVQVLVELWLHCFVGENPPFGSARCVGGFHTLDTYFPVTIGERVLDVCFRTVFPSLPGGGLVLRSPQHWLCTGFGH